MLAVTNRVPLCIKNRGARVGRRNPASHRGGGEGWVKAGGLVYANKAVKALKEPPPCETLALFVREITLKEPAYLEFFVVAHDRKTACVRVLGSFRSSC